jgi:hypothetical protein
MTWVLPCLRCSSGGTGKARPLPRRGPPVGLTFYSPFMHRYGQFPLLFGEADIHNPYLDNYKNFWRAVIAGIGAPLSALVAFGAMKLFSSKNEIDGRKSVDDIRIKVELPDSNNKTDSTQRQSRG